MASWGCRIRTGHFEAVLFSEGLAQYREVLEPGAAVLLQLGAELQGEDVRARVLHAEPLMRPPAKTQKAFFGYSSASTKARSRKTPAVPEPAPQGGPVRGPPTKPLPDAAGGPMAMYRW